MKFTLAIFLFTIIINVPFNTADIQEKEMGGEENQYHVAAFSKLTVGNAEMGEQEISVTESYSLSQEQSAVNFADNTELRKAKKESTTQEVVSPSSVSIETGHCTSCNPIVVPGGATRNMTFSFKPYSISSLSTPSELRFTLNGTTLERHNWTLDTWYNYTLYYGNQVGVFDFVAEFDYILSINIAGVIHNTTLSATRDFQITVFQPYVPDVDDSGTDVSDDSGTNDTTLQLPQLLLLDPLLLNCVENPTESLGRTTCTERVNYATFLDQTQNENQSYSWEFYTNFPHRYTIELFHIDFGTSTLLETGNLQSNQTFEYIVHSSDFTIMDRSPGDPHFSNGFTYGNQYSLQFTAYDLYGSWIRTNQKVIVHDFTRPVLTPIPDQVFEYGTPPPSILGDIYDVHPKIFSLSSFLLPTYVRQDHILRRPWDNGKLSFVLPENLPPGDYVFYFIAFGIGESLFNSVDDYFSVTVEPGTPPTFMSYPNSTETYQTHTGEMNLQWNITDSSPALYNLTINGSLYVINQPWNSGEAISFLHTNDAIGTYIYNLTVSDATNLMSSHAITVIAVDTVAPIITRVNTLAYPVDISGNFLEWTAHDISLTGTYSLTSNFLSLQGNWNSGQKVRLPLDGLPLGWHSVNLTVTDNLGNKAEDIFSILIYTSVEIKQKLADIYYEYGNMAEPLSWIPTSNYAAYYHLFLNDKKIQNNVPWNSGVEISVPISDLEPGRYKYHIELFDSLSNFNFDTVIVTVTDSTAPVVLELTDATYEIDNVQRKQLNFTIIELSEFTYFVRLNGNLYDSGNSSSSSLNFSSLSLGNNIVSVSVFDSSGNRVEQLASVILVDTISPRLPETNTPSIFELSYSPLLASWQVVDAMPAEYTIMIDNVIVKLGNWNSTSSVIFSGSQVTPGIYNVTLTATDVSGNAVVASFIVEVQDTIKPQLAEMPENGTISFYQLKQIQWLVNDESGGGNYTLLQNDAVVKTGNWNSLLPIEYNLYATSYKNFVFSLIVADYSGNTLISNRTFSFKLQGTPRIDTLEDLYLENPDHTVQLVWFPQNFGVATYTVTVNGYFIFRDQVWFPTSTINVSLAFILPGIYHYQLTFEDFLGNIATDDVQVTIQDKSPPELEFSTFVYEYNDAQISLFWIASDLHPSNYTIIDQEGNSFSGRWESYITNSFSLTGRTVGRYNFTFIVRDALNYILTEEITVEIVDTSLPVINGVALQYEYTRENLVFIVNDNSYGSYQIFDTNGFNTTGSWNANELIPIPITHLNLGSYNFTFLVVDAGGNSIQENFEFTIRDTTVPLLPSTSERTLNYNSIGETIVWYPVDSDPNTYTITLNDTVVQTGNWDAQIEFTIPKLPISKNFLKIWVFDGSNNTASAVTTITIVDTVAPKLSGQKQFSVEYGDNTQILSWKIEDSNPWQFNITMDGLNLVKNALNNVSAQISLTELTIGIYNYTLTVIDASGNSASITTEVIVHDTTAPLVFAEDASLRTITLDTPVNTLELIWTATDISPSTLTLLLNDSIVLTNNWITNKFSYHSQFSTLGIYNFTAIFADNSLNTASLSYFIEVIDTQPAQIQNNLETLTIELGSTDNSIEWQVVDNSENEYFILKTFNTKFLQTLSVNELIANSGFSQGLSVNELIASTNATIVASGYCSKNCSISYQLPDTTTLQNSQYTLLTYDSSQNIAISTTNVDFVDTTAPEFVLLPLENYSISDRANWAVFDYQTVSYDIRIDGIQIASGNYKMGSSNNIDFSGLTVDTQHSLILTAIDASGNAKSFESTFKIHLNPNSVENSVKHLYLEAGNTEQTLSWQRSTMKKDYKFYVNSNFLKAGTFGTESSFNHFISELAVGEYNFTLIQSAPGVSETSTTLVTVSDTIAPSITVEVFQKETSTMVLVWTAFDRNPDSYTVVLDGILIEVDTWLSGREQHLVLENLNPQSYRIEIIVSDKNQNGNNSIIEFAIDNQTPFPISIYNIYVILLLAFISIPVLVGLRRKNRVQQNFNR